MRHVSERFRDAYGRCGRYLRVSVTDRCNLQCIYCVNQKRQQFIPHERVLRYEEILRVARICRDLGARKARITGGEPLVRKGLLSFLRNFRAQLPDMRLCMTTNGILLSSALPDMAALGLHSFNLSLDTFDRNTFAGITGQDALDSVVAALEKLLSAGQKVKINAVAMRGVTDVQLADFLHAIREYPVDLRFIEFMPMGGNTIWNQENFIAASELYALIAQKARLCPAEPEDSDLSGPAKMFSVSGSRGRFGFISAVSDHFCRTCNRLRLTSSGQLRTCLFSDREYDLSRLLRTPRISDTSIAMVIQAAMLRKPLGAELLKNRTLMPVSQKQMVGIGG